MEVLSMRMMDYLIPVNCVIPGLIFQVKSNQFGAIRGLNKMLLNTVLISIQNAII